MKVLHTSDWHLGHTLYNYDRSEEQQAMLDQITRIVAERQPDLFLLCGDVYHTVQPNAATQQLFINALMRIRAAAPAMKILLLAGNHDSATRHEIFRTAWEALGVIAIGLVNREESPDHYIVELPGKGFVVGVPYVHERNLPEGFFQRLLDRVAERNPERLPVILTAHTYVSGRDATGHADAEGEAVGGIEGWDLSLFGSGYDYLALGHIHHAQEVRGSEGRARYCGSPLPVHFDECYPHSVSWVELDHHGDAPRVEAIEMMNPRPLITLPVSEAADWDNVKSLFQAFPDEQPGYIRLRVEVDDFLPPGAQMEAASIAEGKTCRFCLIQAQRKERKSDSEGGRMFTTAEIQQLSPLDIATLYAKDKGIDFEEDLVSLFKETLTQLQAEEREE